MNCVELLGWASLLREANNVAIGYGEFHQTDAKDALLTSQVTITRHEKRTATARLKDQSG
jgi:hypothetical protein